MTSEPSQPAAAAAPPERRAARSREHWLVLGGALLTIFTLLVLGLCLTPDASGVGTHKQLGMKPCLTMELWNFPCPGCGVTTSVTMATQGRLLDSFKNQPFGFLVFLGMLGFVGWAGVGQLRGRDLWRDVRALAYGRWFTALVVVCGAAWVYKIWLIHG